MKKIIGIVLLLWAGLILSIMPNKICQASSAVVDLTCSSAEIEVGQQFSVICRVKSQEPFCDVDMRISYDANKVTFLDGGKVVKGGNGEVAIHAKSDSSSKTKTFSLSFYANQIGTCMFEPFGAVTVKDEEGIKFSISSNRASITLTNAVQPDGTVIGEDGISKMAEPVPTSHPLNLDQNTKLKSLFIDCISMEPKFNNDIGDYTVRVDSRTEKLFINYTLANKKQQVKINKNEELMPGENKLGITVTAESGAQRKFKFRVIKETESETLIREQKERGDSNVTFSVYERDGKIFLQNQYQFQVVNVKDETIIPSGYVKTSIEIDHKTVSAYTVEKDLDNNYLLLYLKGTGGEPTLYQFDRTEKTIQKYTGTMTQKVNKGGKNEEEKGLPNMWLYAIIIALILLVLILLIIILNMLLRRKVAKGKRQLDDMDF